MVETVTRTSVDIRQDVLNQITHDNRVDASDIQVDVDSEGTVVLSGSVPTFAQRRHIEEDAYFAADVLQVDNRLRVRLPDSARAYEDAEIASNIMNHLLWDTNIDTTEVNAAAEQGRVTLTGVVESYWQKHKAEELAGNTAGVTAVDNRLEVHLEKQLSDDEIRQAITVDLANSISDDAPRITVEVDAGAVTLNGTVAGPYARTAAANIARYMRGVTDVKNNLKVQP